MSSIATIHSVPAPMGDNRTLAEVFESYAARNLFAEKTIYQYGVQIRHFDKFLGRPATLADLDDDVVCRFLIDRAKATTPANANKCRNHIVALWKFAARKRWTAEFPDVPKLKEPRRNPDAWTAAEFAKLVETAFLGQGWLSRSMVGGFHIAGLPANLWWVGLLLVIYNTAGRIGAILQLRTDDVNLDTGRIMLRAECSKTLTDQPFTLDPATVAILRQFEGTKRELLFPFPFCEPTLYIYFRRLVKAAGLPVEKRNAFHKLRRTVATLSEIHIGAGAATGILGHSSRAVTIRSYIDRSQLPDSNVGQRLPRALLVGQESETGDAPSAESMLPAGPPAPVPIEHHVSAVILPNKPAGDDALLEVDPLTLLAAFASEDFSDVQEWFRRRIASELKDTFINGRFDSVRKLTASGLIAWFDGERQAGRLAATTIAHRLWASWRFIGWLVKARRLYGLAREVDALGNKSGKKRGRPRKGGAT